MRWAPRPEARSSSLGVQFALTLSLSLSLSSVLERTHRYRLLSKHANIRRRSVPSTKRETNNCRKNKQRRIENERTNEEDEDDETTILFLQRCPDARSSCPSPDNRGNRKEKKKRSVFVHRRGPTQFVARQVSYFVKF